MRAEDRQIAELLKAGLKAEEIAGALEMDLSVVHHRILTVPSLGALAGSTGRDVVRSGLESLSHDAVVVLRDLMLFGETEKVKLSAATFVLSRFAGEAGKDTPPAPQKVINTKAADAAARIAAVKNKLKPKEINPEEVKPANLLPLGDLIAAGVEV